MLMKVKKNRLKRGKKYRKNGIHKTNGMACMPFVLSRKKWFIKKDLQVPEFFKANSDANFFSTCHKLFLDTADGMVVYFRTIKKFKLTKLF